MEPESQQSRSSGTQRKKNVKAKAKRTTFKKKLSTIDEGDEDDDEPKTYEIVDSDDDDAGP